MNLLLTKSYTYGIMLFLVISCTATSGKKNPDTLRTGAERTKLYLHLLKDQKVGFVGNHTSMIGHTHLVDSLLKLGINIVRVFSPEHGFRGNADAGAVIASGIDQKSGLPVISLYGDHKKPTKDDLKDIELFIFDIQDVGVRFYTYISTMTYVMEACAENNIPLIILDRPNPNGHYVDGPVLDTTFRSFIGLHAVPVVHGMTVGEYARMLNGEGWLENGLQCDIKLIPVENYTHHTFYELPVNPSPNLKNMNAIYLYPSLCFFEGTIVSVGRGTKHPFEVFGHPDFAIGSYVFTPESMKGAGNPKYEGQNCYGTSLISYTKTSGIPYQINLSWLFNYYDYFKEKDGFFNSYFDKLAGTDKLRKKIENGISKEEIKISWQDDLNAFKKIRKKYLLYDE